MVTCVMKFFSRINITSMKWRFPVDVVYNPRINECLKRKFYSSIAHLVILYGFDCYPTIKGNERRLAIMERKILR